MIRFLRKLFSKAKAVTVPKVYKYSIYVPDGRGTICHTNDEQTENLAAQGFYIREDGAVACIVCGGNCGQCGNTAKLGNIGFSMNHMVKQLHAAPNQHVVWERKQ